MQKRALFLLLILNFKSKPIMYVKYESEKKLYKMYTIQMQWFTYDKYT